MENEKNKSYWLSTHPIPKLNKLENNVTADIVIIGAGIAGITTGYLLQKNGHNVTIIEGSRILNGVTGYTTAKITSLHNCIYSKLHSSFGMETARLYGESQEQGLAFIRGVIAENQIDCDFKTANAYTYATSAKTEETIKKEAEIARSIGLPAEFTTSSELPYPTRGAVKFSNQAHFHPLKYLSVLLQVFIEAGGKIYEHTMIHKVEKGKPFKLKTETATISANKVIVTTNYPFMFDGGFFAKLTPKRSYVLGVYLNEPVPRGMYISQDDPLYSLRPQPTGHGDLLIVTGFEHITGQEPNTEKCYSKLEEITRQYFSVNKIAYRWSTHDSYSFDQIPFIGQVTGKDPDYFVATGFGGWGMTNGTVAGLLLNDLISGKTNPWSSVYNPSRGKQIKQASKFVKQNLGVAKELLQGKLKGRPESYSHLKLGHGEIIDLEGEKVAVHRSFSNKIAIVTPNCTHMGCTVTFNNAEQSWDCPCHGSRFDPEGNVLHGPATKPLEKLN